jgi:hypothetical protein
MPSPDNSFILFDLYHWLAWWKIHVEPLSADRLLDDAIRREQYRWAAAIKRVHGRPGHRTDLSSH